MPCYTGITKKNRVEQDVAEQLADVIYQNVPGIGAHRLAEKIYEAKGPVDLDEREINILLNSSNIFTGVFADSLKDWILFLSNSSETPKNINVNNE